jgi:hypothetical protein
MEKIKKEDTMKEIQKQLAAALTDANNVYQGATDRALLTKSDQTHEKANAALIEAFMTGLIDYILTNRDI